MKLCTQPGAKSGKPSVKGPPKPGHEKAEKDGGDDCGNRDLLRAQGGGEEVELQLLGDAAFWLKKLPPPMTTCLTLGLSESHLNATKLAFG